MFDDNNWVLVDRLPGDGNGVIAGGGTCIDVIAGQFVVLHVNYFS